MAIGGYTTAILSHDHHMNLRRDAADGVRDLVRLWASRRHAGAAAVGRLSRARDVRARRLGPAASVQVLEVRRAAATGSGPRRRPRNSGCTGSAGRAPAIAFVAAWLAAPRRGSAARSARCATARSRPRRRASRSPIYKTFAFGVSAAFAGVAGSLFVLVDERLRPAGRVRRRPLAAAPDRRRRGRARLALGHRRRRRSSSGFCPRSRRAPRHRHRARPGRRLRPDRDPGHAPRSRTVRRAFGVLIASQIRYQIGADERHNRHGSGFPGHNHA